jgi:putative CocE/NonD family hydrolase
LTHDLVNPFDPNNAQNDTLLNNNLTTGDQRLMTGPDAVTYESAPLNHDVEATGPITARLFAKTTASDTDFVFKLIDVFPDAAQSAGPQPGFWNLVTLGNLKGTFRTYKGQFAEQTPIPTGQVVQYDIEGKPTSYLFKAGHRIAVMIESSDSPRLFPNPNPAMVTILHSPQYPSEITLPIIGVQ